jgi:hypothetical protein
MFLLAAAALATAPTPPQAPTASAQATATIRVVAGVRLKLDAAVNPGAPDARDAVLQLGDGTSQRARLIEFQ